MAGPTPPYQVKAVYEYSSPHNDDLSFPNGQIISVTDEEDSDWFYGEYMDALGVKQEGLFPRNFVKMYEPETPPRPPRPSRQKKDTEQSPMVNQEEPYEPVAQRTRVPPEATLAPEDKKPGPNAASPIPGGVQEPKPSNTASEAPLTTKKNDPPPVNENPAGGSFRDRINAFNKPAAPPVAPKPGGSGPTSGSGFIKKTFVAPPPSKNAYVPPPREAPPQKVYRREEDPDVAGQPDLVEPTERPNPPQMPTSSDTGEDQPKPTSLKDRIALLQRQQMEQAARHAEGAQKKEKPKRPPKKRMGSHEKTQEPADEYDSQNLDKVTSVGTTESQRYNQVGDEDRLNEPSAAKPVRDRSSALVSSPPTAMARDFHSDANDADQSGAGDSDGEEISTGRDESDEKPRRAPSMETQRAPQAPAHGPDVGEEEDDADEEQDEEEEEEEKEEEVDPEVKRRMEIRERMAKMSGGMGMAGMFGPPGGISGRAPKKQTSVSSEHKTASGDSEAQASRAPPTPITPMPGLQKVRSPEQEANQEEVDKEPSEPPRSVVQGREPDEMPDMEDMEEESVVAPRRSVERSAPPPIPQDRPVPAPHGQARAVPPPIPTDRPVPSVPSDSRPVPPPSSQPMSPGPGSESDDEMPAMDRGSSLNTTGADSRDQSTYDRPQVSSSSRPIPTLPNRSRELPPTTSNVPLTETFSTSPKNTAISAQRSSRVPPIPGASPVIQPPTPQSRAPPPPPPVATTSRKSTDNQRAMPAIPQTRPPDDSDEEVTEYEGDYDTDMPPDATHKNALKAHVRPASVEGDSTNEEEAMHHSGLPSLGLAPRAVPPPPPPNQPPRPSRQSTDMARAPPPPSQPLKPSRQSGDMPRVPPPPPPPKEQSFTGDDDEYDPYNYASPQRVQPLGISGGTAALEPTTPKLEDPDDLYSASPPRRSKQLGPSQNEPQYSSPSQPSQPPPGRAPRQSLDVQRTSSNIRRSMDAPRPSGEHGFIASDVDLGQNSQWWRQPNTPPPVFQNRRDVIFEIEESSTTRRGARQSITKVVYILYMDYSQTVVTVVFDAQNPAEVALEQHHEPPPARMRQDQLEDAHNRFGARIADEANPKTNSVVGDGSPQGLVQTLFSSLPEALPPVGVRAYGALVYSNLANATIQQLDEIRPGDIVTFRNAKFQGHRGPMHSKYNVDIGKPDHVGVVVDWDGTKKKIRAWEQGRESKKVKMESFKLGDMRSGEAKVWRVMSRQWVGWGGQSS